jgi:hypothetical protein
VLTVVCPYTNLHPLTRDSLRLAPRAVCTRLGNGDRSYWEFLSRLWAKGESVVLVEHDIEVHSGVVPGFESCPEPWCVHPFSRLLPGPHSTWDGDGWSAGIALLTKSLGCVRWSAELMAAEPDLMEAVATVQVGGTPPGHWKTLDDAIARVLEARGYSAHVHSPEVRHHHFLERWNVCACGDSGCRP